MTEPTTFDDSFDIGDLSDLDLGDIDLSKSSDIAALLDDDGDDDDVDFFADVDTDMNFLTEDKKEDNTHQKKEEEEDREKEEEEEELAHKLELDVEPETNKCNDAVNGNDVVHNDDERVGKKKEDEVLSKKNLGVTKLEDDGGWEDEWNDDKDDEAWGDLKGKKDEGEENKVPAIGADEDNQRLIEEGRELFAAACFFFFFKLVDC